MFSFLSLITLFLRLTLAIQGQVGAVVNQTFSEDKLICESSASAEATVHIDPRYWNGNISLSRKLENEERIEVQGESNTGICTSFPFSQFQNKAELFYNPSFGNKPIRGSLLPLYDFFHSWKIFLS